MLKSDGAPFLRNIHFCPNLDKKGWKLEYFSLFWKFLSSVFHKDNAKLKFFWFLTKKPMSGKILVQENCPKCCSLIRLWIFQSVISLKKLRDQVDFLFAGKHHIFLQVSAIAFGGRGQVCPKYLKWQVCNIFVIFQERGRLLQLFFQKDSISLLFA